MSSDTSPATAGEPTPSDPAESLAEEVLALPGVAGLHGGLFGEVATYLPGRRVTGIRLEDERTDVHVSVEWGANVHEVVDAVRRTAEARFGGRVDVYVEDVVGPASV